MPLPVVTIAKKSKHEGLTVEAVELLEDWAPGAKLHCRTTFTRGSPFDPVIGVNVMVHVSVTGPASLQRHRRMSQYRRAHPRELERRTY